MRSEVQVLLDPPSDFCHRQKRVVVAVYSRSECHENDFATLTPGIANGCRSRALPSEAPAAHSHNSGSELWGLSSAGRAPDLHSGGQRFDPARLHQSSCSARSVDQTAISRSETRVGQNWNKHQSSDNASLMSAPSRQIRLKFLRNVQSN